MMTQDDNTKTPDIQPDSGRRKFLNTTALLGLSGVGLSVGLSACNKKEAGAPAATAAPAAAPAASPAGGAHLKPGELDTYYGFWSGGHTGDFRVLGLPSGRELHRAAIAPEL